MTARQRIILQVDAEIAKSGMLDAVKSPDDKKALKRYRQTMISIAEMMAKLVRIPKP